MIHKPYVFLAAAYVHESNKPRFALDRAAYDALVKALRRMETDQCLSLTDSPDQAKVLSSALVALQGALAEPKPAFPSYTLEDLSADCDPSIPRSEEENAWLNAPMGSPEGKS
jgi:hypothetical protein